MNFRATPTALAGTSPKSDKKSFYVYQSYYSRIWGRQEEVEALSAGTGRLEEIYKAKVESLEELKRSVLGKAFAGEL